jgi:lipooligosaccharide transport system permease protein
MKNKECNINVPSAAYRIYSIWYRHFRVYIRYMISNGFPPFLEPLIFLVAIGLGIGNMIAPIEGVTYIVFLASAIVIPPAMFTSAYECTYGTFIRLEFDKTYDGMLGASISVNDLLLGEIIFGGTKGMFFSLCVLIVISVFGLITAPMALLVPVIGLLTGLMFSALSLFVTSYVKTINHFSFYFTGFLTPLYFFSGAIFPLSVLPANIRWIAEIIPLTHPVRIARTFCTGKPSVDLIYDLIYILIFIVVFTFLGIYRLKKRLID